MSVSVDIRLQGRRTPTNPFRTGQGLGQFADADQCDALARAAGAMPLSGFYGFRDRELIEDMVEAIGEQEAGSWQQQAKSQAELWHDPAEGLKTIMVLHKHFLRMFKAEPDNDDLEEIVNDLRAFRKILEKATALKIGFRFEVSA